MKILKREINLSFVLAAILLIPLVFTSIGCNKKKDNNSGLAALALARSLKLKATLPSQVAVNDESLINRILTKMVRFFMPQAYADASIVKKLVLVTPDSFRVVDVSGTTLNVDISREKGKPLGIIFIDDQDTMLGALNIGTLDGDLSVLPLTKVDGNEIDLQSITFSTNSKNEKIATPSNDPIGEAKVINLTDAEKGSSAIMSTLLGIILRNPDVNGNGKVDFLEDKYYQMIIFYVYNAGVIPLYASSSTDGSYAATVSTNVKLDGWAPHVMILSSTTSGGTQWCDNRFPIVFPSSYTWSYGGYTGCDSGAQNTGDPVSGGTHIPTDGTYIVTTPNDGNLSFVLYGQDVVTDRVVIPIPTYHVSGANLQKISWEWKNRNNMSGELIDGSAIIDHLSFQINDLTGGCNPACNRLYDSPVVKGDDLKKTEQVMTQTLPWIDCDRIDLQYNDIFGGQFLIMFARETPGN